MLSSLHCVNVSSTQYLSLHERLCLTYCMCACVWTLSWLVLSVTGWMMGLICPTVLCVRPAQRPHWRTWVKEQIIDSDKALPALIAAGELDYLFKVPSLAEGEPYQWSPDWPHIVLLWTHSGRALVCVCTFGRVCVCLLWLVWNCSQIFMCSYSVTACTCVYVTTWHCYVKLTLTNLVVKLFGFFVAHWLF